MHSSATAISDSMCFLDRLLQHLLPGKQLKAGRKIQLAYKEAAIVSEEGDVIRPHNAAFSIVHRCYYLEVKFKTSYANYKAETSQAPDHFMKTILFPWVTIWSERAGVTLQLIKREKGR